MLRLHQRAIWWTALPLVALAVVLKSWLWWHAFTSAFWLQVLVAFLAVTYASYGLRLLRARRLDCWTVASRPAEAALLLVPLFGPVADAVNLAALLAGWSTARVDWAHCSYELAAAAPAFAAFGVGGFDGLVRRQAHGLRQFGEARGLVGEGHGLDEVLLELRLDGGFDLLDAAHHLLDVVARGHVDERDARAGSRRIAGRLHLGRGRNRG
jgi:hypothetical protein